MMPTWAPDIEPETQMMTDYWYQFDSTVKLEFLNIPFCEQAQVLFRVKNANTKNNEISSLKIDAMASQK